MLARGRQSPERLLDLMPTQGYGLGNRQADQKLRCHGTRRDRGGAALRSKCGVPDPIAIDGELKLDGCTRYRVLGSAHGAWPVEITRIARLPEMIQEDFGIGVLRGAARPVSRRLPGAFAWVST